MRPTETPFLVCADDPIGARAIAATLAVLGAERVETAAPDEAPARAASLGRCVVVIDDDDPSAVFDLARAVLAAADEARVLLVTARLSAERLSAARRAGVHAVCGKPLAATELYRKLRALSATEPAAPRATGTAR